MGINKPMTCIATSALIVAPFAAFVAGYCFGIVRASRNRK